MNTQDKARFFELKCALEAHFKQKCEVECFIRGEEDFYVSIEYKEDSQIRFMFNDTHNTLSDVEGFLEDCKDLKWGFLEAMVNFQAGYFKRYNVQN